jgi:hypothetical protein
MNTKGLLTGVGTGATLVYLFDPAVGSRRRALARDRMARATHRTRHGLGSAMRDIANRSRGIAAATRGRLSKQIVDDRRLVERVRSRLGRACSHPGAIEVEVADGIVTLRGPILTSEIDDVIAAAAALPGIRAVDSAFEVYETAGSIPSLQGEGRVEGRQGAASRGNWSLKKMLMLGGLTATGIFAATRARRSARSRRALRGTDVRESSS